MRIFVAEDDSATLLLLETRLSEWGYDVTSVRDGVEAWNVLQQDTAPMLAILDWMMPGLDGVDVCRHLRATTAGMAKYLILLTCKGRKEDLVTGLAAGANDYVVKPFEDTELRARVQVGERVVQLQSELSQRVTELETALAQVKQLQGLLSICSYCKSIRDDQNAWHRAEAYISRHSEANFSHGICPECFESICKPQLEQFERGQHHA